MLGRDTDKIRSFCLYGETSGEQDEFGLPVRYHWAAEYRGSTAVIYGHTPVPDPALGQQYAVCRYRLLLRRQAFGFALA